MHLLFDWLTVFILIALGVMVKYLKMLWLIAGYNTSKAEDRKVMSEKGIGEFMGNRLFVLAAVLALGNLGSYLGYPVARVVSWILFILVIGYIVVKAQRLTPKNSVSDNQNNRVLILVLVINVAVVGVVAGLIISGNRESTVEIQKQQIKIGGMYSTQIDLSQVKDIRLEDSIPTIRSRTNGYAFGDTLKGNFFLEDLGKGKLYLHSQDGPFVFIVTEKAIRL